jgi:hypothetical protein
VLNGCLHVSPRCDGLDCPVVAPPGPRWCPVATAPVVLAGSSLLHGPMRLAQYHCNIKNETTSPTPPKSLSPWPSTGSIPFYHPAPLICPSTAESTGKYGARCDLSPPAAARAWRDHTQPNRLSTLPSDAPDHSLLLLLLRLLPYTPRCLLVPISADCSHCRSSWTSFTLLQMPP